MNLTRSAIALFIILLSMLLSACSQAPQSIRIAINPWPGYEFIYLAEQQGYFKQQGLNIELVQIASLADGLRAFKAGQVDGMASTTVEVVHAAASSHRQITPILVADASFGGDIIVAQSDIKHVRELTGKRVGLELNSLGVLVLSLALAQHDLSLHDVQLINIEQLDGEQALDNKHIDAFVTYPPIATRLTSKYNTIFTSKQTPNQILDVVTVDASKIPNLAEFTQKFHAAWQLALDFTLANKNVAYQIMAQRQNISIADFQQTVENDLTIYNQSQQANALALVKENINFVCLSLAESQQVNLPCSQVINNIK
ncbi:ABC transporter substrate-binding protein [Saccharobesus litoralis]|uniref:ABC transporter substrate-binding protein n=1 Tax=Saccharobesus litoralis TaxID=2172099 RepID=UPI00131F27D6|nr:ABC transporter substrate-binding protein [Saccharobesus litoralis]